MDHHHSLKSVLAKEIGRRHQALGCLLLIISMFAVVESRSPDIDCLRSIKKSLQDPQQSLDNWVFNDSREVDDYICSFTGVECWGRGAMIRNIRLSGMGLEGEFPRGLANCTSLDGLDLSNNHLHGSIPSDISRSTPYLIMLDLSNNAFSGEIPPQIANCSYLVVLTLNDNILTGQIPPPLASLQRLQSFTVANNLLSGPCTQISRLEKFATRMSFLELRQATDDFSENNVIEIGEKGTVYMANLSIRRLRDAPHVEHEFFSEIMMLGRLRHRNLVPLLGFCLDSNHRFLIYKFMPMGSLHDCLFQSEGEAKIMEWPVRAKIAVGIARGIARLHQNEVVHRGITSECILLDKDFSPGISNFGKATTLNNNNSSWEISVNGEFSDLYGEDVKAFGKVLIELITGTKDNEIISSFDIDADVFVQCLMEQGFDDEISRFFRVAGKCLECDP